MKGFIKRITCLLCALLIATTALLSCPLKVKATSLPASVSSEATIEAMMTLWNILVNGMIASGAGDAVANYDSEKSLFDGFIDFCSSMVATNSEYADSFMARTVGGQYVSLDDLVSAYDKGTITMPDWWVDEWDVDEETGEDVITLPNEQTWGKYRVGFGDDLASILEAWEERGSGSGGSEPEEPKEPEFSKLDTFSINAGFLTMMGDFFTSVWNGEVEDVTYGDVANLGQYYYTGSVPKDENGYYNYKGRVVGYCSLDYESGLKICGYITDNGYLSLGYLPAYSNPTKYDIRSPGNIFSTNTSGIQYKEDMVLMFNFPVFENMEDAFTYLTTGDDSLCTNRLDYDYPELITSMHSVMEPLSGVQLSPSTLQKTYTGMKTSYEEDVKTQTSTDIATNTQTYTETMSQTVKDTVTSVSPSPAPSPDMPGTGTDTGTETETELDDYKVDLRMVFPFCLPFDFIALLQALDAEPETPKFKIPFVVPALDLEMTVDIDLSFLDGVMENLRKIELVGFIVYLIFATGKLIKW